MNNDGFNDVAINSFNNNDSINRSYIYSGLDGSLLYQLDDDSAGDGMAIMCGIGDRNEDGRGDFVVSAAGYENILPRKVYIFETPEGIYPIVLTSADAVDSIKGDTPGDNFGFKCARIKDLDSDGYDDVIISTPFFDALVFGYFIVISSKTLVTLFIDSSDVYGDTFGQEISSAGDFNNDGIDDIVIGA